TIIQKIEKQNMKSAIDSGFSHPIVILINGIYRGIEEMNILASIRSLHENNSEEFSAVSGIILKTLSGMTFFPNNSAKNKLLDDHFIDLNQIGVSIMEIPTDYYNDTSN
ncbi:MAG: hypothetical protein AABX51_00135, partial [Nanoarchaeota archaeon]